MFLHLFFQLVHQSWVFLDLFHVNQHTFFLGSTAEAAVQDELAEGLRESVRVCGRLCLCCMAGPGGDGRGWCEPAPMRRIWCLFEIFTALRAPGAPLPVSIQFGAREEEQFREALARGGSQPVHAALDALDAATAHATVPTDREFILGLIERDVGIAAFNRVIRDGLRRAYSEINTKHSLR